MIPDKFESPEPSDVTPKPEDEKGKRSRERTADEQEEAKIAGVVQQNLPSEPEEGIQGAAEKKRKVSETPEQKDSETPEGIPPFPFLGPGISKQIIGKLQFKHQKILRQVDRLANKLTVAQVKKEDFELLVKFTGWLVTRLRGKLSREQEEFLSLPHNIRQQMASSKLSDLKQIYSTQLKYPLVRILAAHLSSAELEELKALYPNVILKDVLETAGTCIAVKEGTKIPEDDFLNNLVEQKEFLLAAQLVHMVSDPVQKERLVGNVVISLSHKIIDERVYASLEASCKTVGNPDWKNAMFARLCSCMGLSYLSRGQMKQALAFITQSIKHAENINELPAREHIFLGILENQILGCLELQIPLPGDLFQRFFNSMEQSISTIADLDHKASLLINLYMHEALFYASKTNFEQCGYALTSVIKCLEMVPDESQRIMLFCNVIPLLVPEMLPQDDQKGIKLLEILRRIPRQFSKQLINNLAQVLNTVTDPYTRARAEVIFIDSLNYGGHADLLPPYIERFIKTCSQIDNPEQKTEVYQEFSKTIFEPFERSFDRNIFESMVKAVKAIPDSDSKYGMLLSLYLENARFHFSNKLPGADRADFDKATLFAHEIQDPALRDSALRYIDMIIRGIKF